MVLPVSTLRPEGIYPRSNSSPMRYTRESGDFLAEIH